jgi:DNA-binding response OmpR family regulator
MAEDCWDTAHAIARRRRPALVPVIAVSLLDEQARALGLGAAAYLGKPIDRARLRAVLASLRGG